MVPAGPAGDTGTAGGGTAARASPLTDPAGGLLASVATTGPAAAAEISITGPAGTAALGTRPSTRSSTRRSPPRRRPWGLPPHRSPLGWRGPRRARRRRRHGRGGRSRLRLTHGGNQLPHHLPKGETPPPQRKRRGLGPHRPRLHRRPLCRRSNRRPPRCCRDLYHQPLCPRRGRRGSGPCRPSRTPLPRPPEPLRHLGTKGEEAAPLPAPHGPRLGLRLLQQRLHRPHRRHGRRPGSIRPRPRRSPLGSLLGHPGHAFA